MGKEDLDNLSGRVAHRKRHARHWDVLAQDKAPKLWLGSYYQRRLQTIYRSLAVGVSSVLEIGCREGDLLAALDPKFGVGIDISHASVANARERHDGLHFLQCDAHEIALAGTFDLIILSDLLNEVWDVQTVLEQVRKLCGPNTRVVINSYSRLWQPQLFLARLLGMAKPLLPQNWLTIDDIRNLEHLANFEPIRNWQEILLPVPIPLLAPFVNKILVKIPPFNIFALTNFFVSKKSNAVSKQDPSVSVIIAARNEAGNIPALFKRIPKMGRSTELIFVEGHSQDDTYLVIEEQIANQDRFPAKLFRQTGRGKGDAVRLGFEKASGDVLMILDADISVLPEDLPRFVEAIVAGKGEFINGVRLVYPMEDQAMRFANLLGNKTFSQIFSWLFGQPVKDTLCGTKVLTREHYQRIANNRDYFGDFDPFGDFDLLFGAARLNLKITDLPIRYHSRTYGDTNISRWSDGLLLLRMTLFAARKIKFV